MLCPCCAMDIETIKHMYENCNHSEIERVRLGAEKICSDMVQDIMDNWRINTELVKLNGIGSNNVPWGVWGIISGREQGVVTCPWGEKVWKKIQELREYPRWLWVAGLVPKWHSKSKGGSLSTSQSVIGGPCPPAYSCDPPRWRADP